MGTMIGTGNDVVSYLKAQHEQVKLMFQDVIGAEGEERARAFYSLRRMLAVHETAEEEIIHPVARKELDDGKAIVDARLAEERQAKTTLAELESLDVDSDEFDLKLIDLQAAVLAHAQSEEEMEFARLGAILDAGKLDRMRRAAEFAEMVAPTRPHKGVESAAANLLVGPFASMVDRARDAISRKH